MESNYTIYNLADLNPRPESRYLLNMSLGGERVRSGRFGEDKNVLILTRIEPRLFQSLAYGQEGLTSGRYKEYRKCYCVIALGIRLLLQSLYSIDLCVKVKLPLIVSALVQRNVTMVTCVITLNGEQT
jgi:hypothetical protein